eukprot:CAMPEP_0172516622 /NCGR_PEP_ID=MMETSP1066-20121228/277760_1 /TAXON_ID=671091 /ORGANISM="Coscinodiscus wailesii, Strain CCMP2513" /LENGTH=395 /DNA_ID=CAMNT_0013298185 /DNA_START=1 /DNA_END=1188 /DNA_ORIENTATION=-
MLAIFLVAFFSPRARGFIGTLPSSPSFRQTPYTAAPLRAVIYYPDGVTESDFDDGAEEWRPKDPFAEPFEPNEPNILLDHLNDPDLRAPLAVMAAARENIAVETIEYAKVVSVSKDRINIEALCSREDMHCVSALATIYFPQIVDGTDLDVLDVLAGLYTQALAILEHRKIKTGTVISYNTGRGFGFIALDDGSPDAYVHYSDILIDGYRKLKIGQRVECKTNIDTRRGTGKPYAFEVKSEGAAAAAAAAIENMPIASIGDDVFDRSNLARKLDVDLSGTGKQNTGRIEVQTARTVVEQADLETQNDVQESVAGATEAGLRTEADMSTEEELTTEVARIEKAPGKPERDYASLDLEDRAFYILLDLGLITMNLDPDDPDYNDSKDEELAPVNVWL